MSEPHEMSLEEVELLNKRLAYDPLTGAFTWKVNVGSGYVGKPAGTPSTWGYLRINIRRKRFSAHRVAWFLVHGEWPAGQIDHIDGDKLNNRISNLRVVTPSLNQLCNTKRRKHNTTGYTGVVRSRSGFRAQIKVDGKAQFLGEFESPMSAAAAYEAARLAALSAHAVAHTEQGT